MNFIHEHFSHRRESAFNWKLETGNLLPFSNILSLKPARRVALFFSRNYRFCNLTGVFLASRKMQNMLYNIPHRRVCSPAAKGTFDLFGCCIDTPAAGKGCL